MNYRYDVYGLQISSPIELKELRVSTETTCDNSCIRLVSRPIHHESPLPTSDKPVIFEASQNTFFCHVLGVGRYLVEREGTISIDLETNCNNTLFKTFLYGSVLSSAVYFRGLLPLHASAVEINGKAVAFCGDSGAGKSTTSAIFQQAGYPIIADDIVALQRTEDVRFHAHPGPAISKLSPESVELTNCPTNGSEFLIEKYHINSGLWTEKKTINLAALFILEIDEHTMDLQITPLKGIEKTTSIMRYLYRHYRIAKFELEAQINQLCIELSLQISVFKIKRPRDRPIAPNSLLTSVQKTLNLAPNR